jgi:hypothetical protein
MVIRYVARVLGKSANEVSPNEAAGLVPELAAKKSWDVIQTDHAIWRFESGRPVNRDGYPVEPEPEPEEDYSRTSRVTVRIAVTDQPLGTPSVFGAGLEFSRRNVDLVDTEPCRCLDL